MRIVVFPSAKSFFIRSSTFFSYVHMHVMFIFGLVSLKFSQIKIHHCNSSISNHAIIVPLKHEMLQGPYVGHSILVSPKLPLYHSLHVQRCMGPHVISFLTPFFPTRRAGVWPCDVRWTGQQGQSHDKMPLGFSTNTQCNIMVAFRKIM